MMKSHKLWGLLVGTILLSSASQPSFGKQIWLKCVSSSGVDTRIIYLDDVSERFEITEVLNQTIQGKATFFTSVIQLEYLSKVASITFKHIMEIDRATLMYSSTIDIIGGIGGSTPFSGACKVIPAPSGKKNLI